MKSIDSSYATLDSCKNCRHAFRKCDWDDADTFFCHRDKSKRPKCGSVGMGEYSSSFWRKGKGDIWERWAKKHLVSEVGKCKYWRTVNVVAK